jgi:5'-nucleotidase / UDP-sugar diphosphatase
MSYSTCCWRPLLITAWLWLLQLTGPVVCAAFNLTILHVNDHHSHLESERFNVDVKKLPFTLATNVTTVVVPYGGFARLKTLMDRYQQDDKSTNAVLKLHAGDALVGTPIYSIFQSQADAALMRQLCFDAFCLGNHVSCLE